MATIRAKIQKIIMAAGPLYRWLPDLPSASCNGPGLRLRCGPRGEEQNDPEAHGGDQIPRAVCRGKEAPDGPGQDDPVTQPAQTSARPGEHILSEGSLFAELRRPDVYGIRGNRHMSAVGENGHQIHGDPHHHEPDPWQAVVVPG